LPRKDSKSRSPKEIGVWPQRSMTATQLKRPKKITVQEDTPAVCHFRVSRFHLFKPLKIPVLPVAVWVKSRDAWDGV